MVAPLARTTPDASAPRVEPRGIGVALDAAHPVAWVEDALAPGDRPLTGTALVLGIARTDHGDAATLELALENRGDVPLHVAAVTLGLVFRGHGHASHRFLRHGWQSWSFAGARDLDDAGEPVFPSGPWLRGMYHCVGEPGPARRGWHESETFTLVGPPRGGPCCLVGVLETGAAFGVVYLKPGPAADGERPVDVDVELRVEATLAPGERRVLEAVRIAVHADPNALLDRFATLWGRVGGARAAGAFQTGWCSWYHYFHRIDEASLLRNLDALSAARGDLPIDVVQLDDGFQRTIGDWLATNAKFPRGLAPIAEAIREAGFRPGIWTAPFAASAESDVLRAHPDWAIADEAGPLRGSLNPEWSEDGWVYALDPSRPGLRDHLERTFRELVALGFTYLKLDFLYMAAMEGRAADPTMTRAARLRAGLEAIRRGAGEDAFLLGCGCPLGPAVGVVDGMRIGPDVAPSWRVDQPAVIPGLEPVLPSTRSAIGSVLARVPLHRRLWLNDPDCLMARSRETALTPDEARSLAAAIAVSGGMVVVSDDVALLDERERHLVAGTVEAARRIDAAGAGAAHLVDPLSAEPVRRLEADARDGAVFRAAINLGDSPAAGASSESDWSIRAVGEGRAIAGLGPADASGDGALAAHAARPTRHADGRSLAVFCDFDGTFSVRDVGSTLAQAELGEKRGDLWGRYEAGEIDAWEYAELLFDGFRYGPEALDRFLATIELDAGARELVEWCAGRGVPLRILSDGFDYNLERLQAVHGVAFDFTANRLRFEDDRWRIAPGHRNPACDCGTGCCKRSLIELHRASHPRDFVVHVGNGRVSDRCGAEAADLAFAKDTLAPALDERGVRYLPFETLSDVVAALARLRPAEGRPTG